MFSRAWKFDHDDEYDEFHTNWVSGWYLSKLILTGHRYDAETALIFDFGSGESKVLLCSYADGTVTSTELLKYPQMLRCFVFVFVLVLVLVMMLVLVLVF